LKSQIPNIAEAIQTENKKPADFNIYNTSGITEMSVEENKPKVVQSDYCTL